MENGKEAECVVFTHENSPNKTYNFVNRWVPVVQEVRPIHIFDTDKRNVVLEEVGTKGNPNDPTNTI